jgi:hypothetical protein
MTPPGFRLMMGPIFFLCLYGRRSPDSFALWMDHLYPLVSLLLLIFYLIIFLLLTTFLFLSNFVFLIGLLFPRTP